VKKTALFFIAFLYCLTALPQQENSEQEAMLTEQQLENLAEQQNGELEDDIYLQSLVNFSKSKLNLNTAEENDFRQLQLVSDIQIENFFKYKKLLGNLISIYELQAIPSWDLKTIQSVLPFVKVNEATQFGANFKQRLINGQHSLLLRWQEVIERSDGFLRPDSVVTRYAGSPEKVLLRYKYMYRNLFQFGLTGDKDAGEQFFKGTEKQGFDFYSFHLFARKIGPVKLLAIGDFTVNLGQGLIQWQNLAFKKGSDITAVKRQAEIIRPYNSSGEYNFMRGTGISVGLKSFDFTAFGSVHKLDGTLHSDTSQTNEDYISSILSAGYHRTTTEIDKKNAISQSTAGGNISYNKPGFHVGVNGIAFKFSSPLVRSAYPYTQYAIGGEDWYNYSADYSFTCRNFHFFGEAAADKNESKAFVGGLLASLDEKVDASIVYRDIEKSYQALYGNAFTENTSPTNEKGLFTGLAIKPYPFLRIDAYADIFSFPWLKYRVDAPSNGSAYLLQIAYNPSRKIGCYTRFKNDNKALNVSGTDAAMRQVLEQPKESWRTQVDYSISRQFTLNQRVELLWFNPYEKGKSEQGFLLYVEGKYRLKSAPVSINGRLQYFETDGFNSRIYSYESDVLYSYSIPQFIGKGFRYYLNSKCDFNKKMTVWFKWSQTILANQNSIGSGLDKIAGNKKSEIKLQLLYNF
jgi:hypothetical protein